MPVAQSLIVGQLRYEIVELTPGRLTQRLLRTRVERASAAARRVDGRAELGDLCTLGTELREGSRGVLLQVLKANNAATAPARQAELLALRERIEALTMTLRVAKEVKAFRSFAANLHAVALRLEGWLGVKRGGRADLRGAHKAAYDLWQAHGAGAPGASCA